MTALKTYRCFLCREERLINGGHWCDRYGCSTTASSALFEIGCFTVTGNDSYVKILRRGQDHQQKLAWISIRLFDGMGIFSDRRTEVIATFGADVLEEFWNSPTEDQSVFRKLERIRALK